MVFALSESLQRSEKTMAVAAVLTQTTVRRHYFHYSSLPIHHSDWHADSNGGGDGHGSRDSRFQSRVAHTTRPHFSGGQLRFRLVFTFSWVQSCWHYLGDSSPAGQLLLQTEQRKRLCGISC